MNKAIKVIFPVLAAASILASCTPETAGGGSGTINLLIWEDASNIETIEKIAEYFKADYKRAYPLAPDIEFTFEARNEAAAVSDLLTIGESGEGPDIAAITMQATMAAFDRPPALCPRHTRPKPKRLCEIPPTLMRLPIRRKNGIDIKVMPETWEYIR